MCESLYCTNYYNVSLGYSKHVKVTDYHLPYPDKYMAIISPKQNILITVTVQPHDKI